MLLSMPARRGFTDVLVCAGTMKEDIQGVKLIGQQEVAGVNNSSIDNTRTWLTEWEKCCKRSAGKCAAKGCSTDAAVGGHVWVSSS